MVHINRFLTKVRPSVLHNFVCVTFSVTMGKFYVIAYFQLNVVTQILRIQIFGTNVSADLRMSNWGNLGTFGILKVKL